MKTKINLAILFLSLAFFAHAAPGQQPTPKPAPSPTPSDAVADVSGKWSVVADAGGQTVEILMDLKQTGSDVKGSTNSEMGAGTIDGGKVTGNTFTGILHADVQGQSVDFKIDGSVKGDKMTGTFTNSSFGSVPFTAERSK